MTHQTAKRVLDLALGSLLWFVFSPVMLFLLLLIKLKMPGPVLFKQMRPGLDGKPFVLYKLRTMTMAKDADGRLLPDEQRLTSLGSLLRSTSLDELPELINVINGEMSLVGPRPLLMRYLARYSPRQMRRHEVKPGITGWAQINGRNALTWEEKFDLDLWYVEHCSVALDIKILLTTLGRVLARQGIRHHGQATMPEFLGD